jgi:hypothetical protein
MAVNLSIGRITTISLLAILGLAVAAGGADYFSSRPAREAEIAAISQDMAAVPSPTLQSSSVPNLAPPQSRTERAQREAAEPAAAQLSVSTEPEPEPAATAAATERRITLTRLVIEPQESTEPRELAVSISRPKNMASIPTRAPRAADAASRASRIAKLFEKGAEIDFRRDASVYITSRNIPEDDRLLGAYSADTPDSGGVRTGAGEAGVAPGLLGIAAQARRYQWRDQGNQAFSLADAMRDAIWRKKTAARLKSITTSQNACAGGMARRAPSISLVSGC